MIPIFDEHMFQMGWFNHQLDNKNWGFFGANLDVLANIRFFTSKKGEVHRGFLRTLKMFTSIGDETVSTTSSPENKSNDSVISEK